jgi:lipoprotein NlpD
VAQAVPYRVDSVIRPTPVSPSSPSPAAGDDGQTHVVQAGENLFRISLSHGLKYQVVATWNNLPDYTVKVGQVLRLTPPSSVQTGALKSPAAHNATVIAPPALKHYPKALKLAYSDNAARAISAQSEGASRPEPAPAKTDSSAPSGNAGTAPSAARNEASAAAGGAEEGISWAWPVNGKLLRAYSDSNKGVDIGGRMGQAVVAAADGKVVYSGNGLRGYGKLIIIKHNKTFLSAYAHNSALSVKEGQSVKKGQKIAEMGNSDADQVKLHFEIRRFGKPIDPMQYLNSKP